MTPIDFNQSSTSSGHSVMGRLRAPEAERMPTFPIEMHFRGGPCLSQGRIVDERVLHRIHDIAERVLALWASR